MNKKPTKSTPLYIGIDGGGSKCKATIVDNQGNQLGTGIGGPANPFHNQQTAINSIIDSTQRALMDAQLPESSLGGLIAGIGLAGINVPSVFNSMSQWQHPFAEMHLTTDLLIACLGAHQGGDGAIIITGTGSCGFSYVNGKEVMLGGHGFPHGDKGSGAWLGFKAVEQVLLSLDGLSAPSSMNIPLLTKLNCKNTIDIVEVVAKKTATFYASLAGILLEAAGNKDKLALSIVKEGTEYINMLARQLNKAKPPRMSLIGGLNHSLINYLDDDVVNLLSAPLSEPEMGAVLYAKQQKNAQAT